MTYITASLALAALQVVESALRGGQAVSPAALGAVNSGLSGLITQGTEPTAAQAEAVSAAIGNLIAADTVAEPVVADAPQPTA